MELHPERLGVFVSILIARQCFSLQSFVVKVVTRSLVKAWNEGKILQGQMPSPVLVSPCSF